MGQAGCRRAWAVGVILISVAAISTGCSGSGDTSLPAIGELGPCGKPDKPLRSPATVDSWTPIAANVGFTPQTAGYYFATTYAFTCKEGEFRTETEGTYLRFFSNGTVRQNTLAEGARFDQDPDIIMENLSMNGFESPIAATEGWGCCSRGEGTVLSTGFSIDKFEPSMANHQERWEITEVGSTAFTAVLPDGSSGSRYQFQFHSAP